jgi:hypothetical protein
MADPIRRSSLTLFSGTENRVAVSAFLASARALAADEE